MNEQEFAEYVLLKVEKDINLLHWYDTRVKGTKLEDTVHTIVYGMHQSEGLTFEDAVLLSIFIGLTTQNRIREQIQEERNKS